MKQTSLTYFSGQIWKLNNATLSNQAGLWKSKDTWNFIPYEPEISGIRITTDDKGELDIFLIVKKYITGS